MLTESCHNAVFVFLLTLLSLLCSRPTAFGAKCTDTALCCKNTHNGSKVKCITIECQMNWGPSKLDIYIYVYIYM